MPPSGAYDLARHYLREDWRKNGNPFWESTLKIPFIDITDAYERSA